MKHCVRLLITNALFACGCSSGYLTENGQVYWQGWNASVGKHRTLVKDADANTFIAMRHDNYGRDSKHCFYRTQCVVGADPDTFTSVTQHHAKDDTHAYLGSEVIVGSDGLTFEWFDSRWGKDAHRCYCDTEPIVGSDPKTFTVISGFLNSWAKDNMSYYHLHNRVPTTDVGSFEILDGGFAKDAREVFYHAKVVEGADASTFRMVEGTFLGKDKNGYYRFGEPFTPTPEFVRMHEG